MCKKKWITGWFYVVLLVLIPNVLINYLIDPYEIYHTSLFSLKKHKQHARIRFAKAVNINRINPKSIILGTSRAEYGFDPSHEFFLQPAYNASTAGSSMYENRLYFEYALEQKFLDNVLLVLDYQMFNSIKEKNVKDFENYFTDKLLKYKYLFSIEQSIDSVLTIQGTSKPSALYLKNGQREKYHRLKYMKSIGKQYPIIIKYESSYYKDYPLNYTYKDTKNKSFDDFKKIIELCYEKNIKLTILFGPSHIRQWEALDYYLDYNLWLEWKKDIVSTVNIISKQYYKKQFDIYDFSVYNEYTSEPIEKNSNKYMQYHFDSSHYKNNLGNLVLDYLTGSFKKNNFAVKLNINNINSHINKLKKDRYRYINVGKYKDEIKKYLSK